MHTRLHDGQNIGSVCADKAEFSLCHCGLCCQHKYKTDGLQSSWSIGELQTCRCAEFVYDKKARMRN